MAHKIDLPEPWEHVETLDTKDQDDLERIAGSRLTYADLSDRDVSGEEGMKLPRSRKSWLVMGHRWNRVKNRETNEEVLVRLQTFGNRTTDISAVIFPFDSIESRVTGANLRDFPVAAIAAAYSYDEQAGRANLATFMHLMQEVSDGEDPLAPLPKASNTDKFSALVARQYLALEEAQDGAYVAQQMATINSKPLTTIQRWITQARKAGFLAPARTGRRPNNG